MFLLLNSNFTYNNKSLTRFGFTSNEWISGVRWWTGTYWTVISHNTFCSYTTRSRARVTTFLISTCFVLRTFRINDTFRSTVRWRTHISGGTRTYGLSVNLPTLTEWTTWRRRANVSWDVYERQ